MTLNKIFTCLQCNDGKDTSCMATCDTIELCEEKKQTIVKLNGNKKSDWTNL